MSDQDFLVNEVFQSIYQIISPALTERGRMDLGVKIKIIESASKMQLNENSTNKVTRVGGATPSVRITWFGTIYEVSDSQFFSAWNNVHRHTSAEDFLQDLLNVRIPPEKKKNLSLPKQVNAFYDEFRSMNDAGILRPEYSLFFMKGAPTTYEARSKFFSRFGGRTLSH